jgi:YggT family protein
VSGPSYFTNALVYLVDTAFLLLIGAVLLRFLLQWARADFHNPICQLLVRGTNPCLRPLRRLIPGWGGLDLASLILAFALQCLNSAIILLLVGHLLGPLGLPLYALAELLSKVYYIEIFSLIVVVVGSWIAPGSYSPILELFRDLVRPLLQPLAQRIPSLGGIDFSTFILFVFLQLGLMLIVLPLRGLAVSLG